MADDETTGASELEQMRALWHPLRMTLMDRIGRRGPARAADLAAELGIPANSVSYHLRILARGGVIVPDPDAGRDRRDKVWRLAHHEHEFNGEEGTSEDFLRAGVSALDWMRDAWLRVVSRPRNPEADPDRAFDGTMRANTVRLSPKDAEEMLAALKEIADRFTDLHRTDGVDDVDVPEGTRTYRYLVALAAEEPAQTS